MNKEIVAEMQRLGPNSKVVVFSGAGMSAESGVSTFRDSGGLWEKHSIEEVATPEAFERNPEKVLNFYNQRRKQLLEVEPNEAHYAIAQLEEKLTIEVITQNIDDLHERAGSKKVLHLHGELRKAESCANKKLVYDIEGWELNLGMLCDEGAQLRPHVVWFGEMVPNMAKAEAIVSAADFLLVIGTSLNVYPAAGIVTWASSSIPKVILDPAPIDLTGLHNAWQINATATQGMKMFRDVLMQRLWYCIS